MSEEERIKKFDEEQLEILLNNLQDIDKFTGFKDGAFKYELGKYQANLLVNYINKYKEVINKAIELLGNYKHYSTPNEEQNSDNEDLVNKAFNILKEVKDK